MRRQVELLELFLLHKYPVGEDLLHNRGPNRLLRQEKGFTHRTSWELEGSHSRAFQAAAPFYTFAGLLRACIGWSFHPRRLPPVHYLQRKDN